MAQGQKARGLLSWVCVLLLCAGWLSRLPDPPAGTGTRPCAPEPSSALPKQRTGRGRLAACPCSSQGSISTHVQTPSSKAGAPLLVHSPGCGTHSSWCVSFRAASGPLAWVSSHCSGGSGAVDPLVCWDHLVRAVQVSCRYGVSVLSQAMPCCGMGGDREGSPAAPTLLWGRGCSWLVLTQVCSRAPSWGSKCLLQGWDGAMCAERPSPLVAGAVPTAPPFCPLGCRWAVPVRAEGECAEPSMPLLLGSAGSGPGRPLPDSGLPFAFPEKRRRPCPAKPRRISTQVGSPAQRGLWGWSWEGSRCISGGPGGILR